MTILGGYACPFSITPQLDSSPIRKLSADLELKIPFSLNVSNPHTKMIHYTHHWWIPLMDTDIIYNVYDPCIQIISNPPMGEMCQAVTLVTSPLTRCRQVQPPTEIPSKPVPLPLSKVGLKRWPLLDKMYRWYKFVTKNHIHFAWSFWPISGGSSKMVVWCCLKIGELPRNWIVLQQAWLEAVIRGLSILTYT